MQRPVILCWLSGGLLVLVGLPALSACDSPAEQPDAGEPDASTTSGAASMTSGATSSSEATATATSGAAPNGRCDDPSLVWKTGRKTTYTSYPDPDSEECIVYNGCMWAGQFAHCDGTFPESWVAEHDIAAVFPDDGLEGHDLCLRSGDRVMVVTAIDTCGDSDCDGCCTENRGDADALIDLESYTNARWGLPDGKLEWADLGPNPEACSR